MLRDRVLHVLRPPGLSRGQRPTLHPRQARAFGAAGLCEEQLRRKQGRSAPPGLPKARAGRRPSPAGFEPVVFSLEPRHPPAPQKRLCGGSQAAPPGGRQEASRLFIRQIKTWAAQGPRPRFPLSLRRMCSQHGKRRQPHPPSLKKKVRVSNPRSEGKDTQDRA